MQILEKLDSGLIPLGVMINDVMYRLPWKGFIDSEQFNVKQDGIYYIDDDHSGLVCVKSGITLYGTIIWSM